MTQEIKRRRGTTAQHASFTGAEAELTVDTDKNAVVIHDGETAGGFPMAREDLTNVPNAAHRQKYRSPVEVKNGASPYAAEAADRGKTFVVTEEATVELQAAATLGDGWFLNVMARGGDVTIEPDGAEEIEGEAGYTVKDGADATIRCDGTGFYVSAGGGGSVDYLRVEQFGVKYDGDETAELKAAIEEAVATGRTLVGRAGQTITVDQVEVEAGGKHVAIESDGPAPLKIKSVTSTDNGAALIIKGEYVTETSLVANAPASARYITVDDATGIEKGHLVALISTKAWYHNPRNTNNHPWGIAQGGTSTTIQLQADALSGTTYVGNLITLVDGDGRGQTRYITDWDDGTKTATVDRAWATNPSSGTKYVIGRARKGELHEVMSVDNNVLELRNELGDGYDVAATDGGTAKEEVTVKAYNPAIVSLNNISAEVDASVQNVVGINLWYCKHGVVDFSHMDRPHQMGVRLNFCFDVPIYRLRVDGANVQNGSGVHGHSCSHIWVYDSKFWGCRRAVDFNSGQVFDDDLIPSWWCGTKDCVNYGGGQDATGTDWGPGGAASYGFGGHGPSVGEHHINPEIHNVTYGLNFRGRSWRVVNPVFYGRMGFLCRTVYSGGDCEIVNPKYRHAVLQGEDSPGSQYMAERLNFDVFDGADFRSNLPASLIRIMRSDQDSHAERGRIRIVNPDVTLQETVFDLLYENATEWADIDIEGGVVTLMPQGSGSAISFIKANSTAAQLNRCRINTRLRIMTPSEPNYQFIRGSGLSMGTDFQINLTQGAVGEVQDRDGIAVGSIIETGSNANGEYIKYADGTLECWKVGITLERGTSSVMRGLWEPPHPFETSKDMVSLVVLRSTAGSFNNISRESLGPVATSGFDAEGNVILEVIVTTGDAQVGATIANCRAWAIGRWK